ncbi:MAG: desulfoferrodoxin family protein [Bacilli bacterium]|jgi:superoxide reductase
MYSQLKFYKCELCGKVIEVLTEHTNPTMCCATEMVRLVANHSDGAKEKHLPVVTINGSKVHVEVGSVLHPMTIEHSIEWIILQTNKGIYRRDLTPSSKPIADFNLVDGEEPISVYAYCNLHGLWETELEK